LFPKAKNERALKKSAVSSPQSKDFLPPEKTNEKLFPALRDNPRRFRFTFYVESILETYRAGKPICFRSESLFNYRIFYNFDSFNRFNRQFFRKLKK